MNKQEFLAYCASFNPKYATKKTAQKLIKQAKKIKEDD